MLKSPSGIQKQLSAAIAIIGQQDFPGKILIFAYLLTTYLNYFDFTLKSEIRKNFAPKLVEFYFRQIVSNCKLHLKKIYIHIIGVASFFILKH